MTSDDRIAESRRTLKQQFRIMLIVILALLGVGIAFLSPNKIAKKEEIKLPEQQVEFCAIVENGKSKYRDLLHRWSAANDAKNGIVTAQLSSEMTTVYRSRNEDIFRLLERTQFNFEDWSMTVLEINSVINGFVELKIHPLCSKITVIHATVAAVPMALEVLAKKKLGDPLVASGTFVEKHTLTKPVSPEKFEMSFTESGSMDEPEYTAAITIPSSAAQQSNPNPAPSAVATAPIAPTTSIKPTAPAAPPSDQKANNDAQTDADKAALIKVMKDAVAARHGGVLPKTMSEEDTNVAAQAAMKWKAKQAAEKAKRELDAMRVKPPPSSGNAEIYLAKEAITKMMRDPDSAVFGDVFFVNDRKSPTGYYVPVVCGSVNGKNSFGGMTGQKHFVAIMSDAVSGVWMEGTTPQNVFAPEWNRYCAGQHN
jgi:hypothetical protein